MRAQRALSKHGSLAANDAVMEKVNGEGNLVGFSILEVSALKGEPPLFIRRKRQTVAI